MKSIHLKIVCLIGISVALFDCGSAIAQELLPPAMTQPAPNRIDNARSNRVTSTRGLTRIEDLVSLEGRRSNYLVETGLVTGLNGTGGKDRATRQSLSNLLQRSGINSVPTDTSSLSVVTVTAELPPDIKPGEKIRVTVSVIDGAKSLQGGTLLPTPLKGFDNQVYAIAAGQLVVGGYSAGGQGASVSKNHVTKAVCEAVVEKEVCQTPIRFDGSFRLLLRHKNFEMATRIKQQINKYFPYTANIYDAGTIKVNIPREWMTRSHEFIAQVYNLKVVPAKPAIIVVNEASGTVVIGEGVKISTSLIALDNLVISTTENPVVSQPAPFSEGETTVLPRTDLKVEERSGNFRKIGGEITIGELANTLNTLGFTPRDLISILGDIQTAGGLQAELVIR